MFTNPLTSFGVSPILSLMQTGRVQLAAYQRRSRLKQYELARLLSLDGGHLSQILSGKRRPSLVIATRIQDLTGVPATSWVDRTVGKAGKPRPRTVRNAQVGNELT